MGRQTTGRVVIDPKFSEKMRLANSVYTKHLADGAESELHKLDGEDWAVSGPLIKPCLALHDEADALAKRAEQLYRERDLKALKVMAAVNSSKNVLKGRYTKNPKKLAEWGFTVDDTPKVKKAKPKP